MNYSARFQGRTFLVTGGSKGIGLATATRLAREGARVVRVARQQEVLDRSRADLGDGDHLDFALDAIDADAVSAWTAKVGDLKFSGAAFCAGTHAMRPARSAGAAHYRTLFDANVVSVTNFVPHLIRNATDNAAFVLVSSATIYRGAAAVSGYAAAKSALIGLTRSLAGELAPKVRVNAIAPGVVSTEMTERFFKMLGEKHAQATADRHLLGVGKPDDVASVIAFLLSDDAKWITGADLAVDGGYAINA